MRNWRLLLVLVIGSTLAAGFAQAGQPDSRGIEFFEKKIRPVLFEHCYRCHSVDAEKSKKLKAGLYLDTRAGILKGGESELPLISRDLKKSLLLKALRHDELKMPPSGPLPKEVVADFEAWVKMGAPDPRDGKPTTSAKREINVELGRKYWAFAPLRQFDPPTVRGQAWVRTPLDRFILAKLEEKSLTPNTTVDRQRLIRRAYFDLWGLPPTPSEIDTFVKNSAKDGYEKLIDRLLAEQHYGERWGRHWLDVARFAESGGYEFDGDRPGAHFYRDFIIKALNQDMPFDEFVRLQLAGDHLKPGDFSAATATGFVVAGPYPGQITAKTRERIRYDHLDDMISTVGSAFLGMSLGCVRCHEHKYDPIPQQDYYRLISCLSRTDSARPKLDPDPTETTRRRNVFDKGHVPLVQALQNYSRETLPTKVAAWSKAEQSKPTTVWQVLEPVTATGKSPLKKLADGSLLAGGKADKAESYTIVAHTHQRGLKALRLEAIIDESLPKNGPGCGGDGGFLLTEVTLTAAPLAARNKPLPVKLRAGRASFEAAGKALGGVLDTDKKTGWSIAGQSGKTHAAVLEFDKEVGFDGGTILKVVLKFDGDGAAIGRPRLALSADPKATLDAPEALQHAAETQYLLKEQQGQVNEKNREAVASWFRVFDPELKRLAAAVEENAGKAPQPKLVDSFVAAEQGREPVFFLIRGEVDRKNGQATPGFIQVLMTAPERDGRWAPGDKKKATVEPRVALARWLTDAEHGAGHLLARVIVNRLWQHHLGRGIVPTPNDFGVQGEAPTHAELLDYLARELIRNGWRLKPIHKLIMTSAVYMQGGEANPAAAKVDPKNDLWWRRPPRRLEAEAIRDALLAVSGTLDKTMHGAGTLDENSNRRSVYLTVKRSQLVPFLQMFDAPEAIQSIAVRTSTTVATQALAMMNSPLVRQRAEKFAQRLQPKSSARLADTIQEAYLAAVGRTPSDTERQRMFAFLLGQQASYGNNPRALDLALADFCQALLCLNEFIYVD